MPERGPALHSLALRFGVLLALVARAAWIYARYWLDERGIVRAAEGSIAAAMQRFAVRFVRIAISYKGGLIKLGQVASLRVDVLPEAVSAELAKLQDQVDAHPLAEIRAQVERELGGRLEQHFASFSERAIAAASLGQVHAAELPDGRKVAVKVLYPGVERSVAVDLAAARVGLWLFDFVTVADLDQVYAQVRDSIRGEMDYVAEGRAADEIARNLAADPELAKRTRVPRIHWPLTRRRVLTMEFVDGVKINDREALAARGVDPREIALWAVRAFLHQMFRDGFFHCDPHPGNLVVDEQGRVGILDFGMHQRLDPRVLSLLRESLLATVARDPVRYARAFLDAEMIRPQDLATVEEIGRISFDPKYWNLTPKELAQIDMGAYVMRMRSQMKRVRSFQIPDGIVLWGRAFGLLLGLASELAPGIRPMEVVGPYVVRFLAAPARARSG
ncbi:MAG TPA: AarF/UbiB family protein [Myxococcota bacterium]|nr:AarF/UbiB family protein [Myxococcota bacterium]